MKELQLYTRDTITGRITMKPPFPPRSISGMEKLVQVVLLALLNDPGRSAFYPEDGSGLPSLIGSNISSDDPNQILAEVSEKVEKIEEEIINTQNELENEEANERLGALIVLNAETGDNIDEILLKLRIVSEAGDVQDLVI